MPHIFDYEGFVIIFERLHERKVHVIKDSMNTARKEYICLLLVRKNKYEKQVNFHR